MTFDILQERALYALIAYFLAVLIDSMLGLSKKSMAVPLIHAMGSFVLSPLLGKLDKLKRGKGLLIARGILVQLFVMAVFAVFAFALHTYVGSFADILLIALCIAPLAPSYLAIKQYKKGDISQGELYALAKSANVNLNATDTHGITRESINWLANSFGKNLVAPLLLYILFGSTVMYLYASITLFVWLRGKYGNSKGFAKPSIYLMSLVSAVPEYIAAFIIALAAYLTPRTRKTESIKSLFNNNITSAEGGVVIFTYAHTLGITLGGAAQHIDGGAIHRPWAGDSDTSAKIEPQVIKKAVYLTISANIILIFVLTVLLL